MDKILFLKASNKIDFKMEDNSNMLMETIKIILIEIKVMDLGITKKIIKIKILARSLQVHLLAKEVIIQIKVKL